MKLNKPVGLNDFVVGNSYIMDDLLVNLAHYDRDTQEFSFEELLSHLKFGYKNTLNIIVLTKEQLEERMVSTYILPHEVN